ncbi:MAG TPA: primosomal protein N' [Ktedonobacterales bacterium]|nr:primosomal protein N' [Ktedonobacterales bacterium]
MRAEILALRGMAGPPSRLPRPDPTADLIGYHVPDELAAAIQPGQLVAIPLGARVGVGLVWALDASDELDDVNIMDDQDDADGPDDADDTATAWGDEQSGDTLRERSTVYATQYTTRRLRAIKSILLDEPMVLAAQRALAEWIAAYYSAPLGQAARLMAPPGLLASVRVVMRPTDADASANGDASAEAPSEASAAMEIAEAGWRTGQTIAPIIGARIVNDADAVLALLRERGWLERDQVVTTLGAKRGGSALRTLTERNAVTLRAELPGVMLHPRQERRVALTGDPERLADWRAAARATLDSLVTLAAEAPAETPADATQAAATSQRRRVDVRHTGQRQRRRLGGVVAALRAPASAPPTARVAGATTADERRMERQAERILRQLAALDVLERTARAADGAGDLALNSPTAATPTPTADAPATEADVAWQPDLDVARDLRRSWRLEELRRLTRVTPAALAELAAAGLVAIQTVEVRRDPLAGADILRTAPLTLTTQQAHALDVILGRVAPTGRTSSETAGESARVCLLHGVTGSGKTEVYLQALAHVIAQGKRGLALVPEIALTPQAMARFAGRFPGRVALLHSGLTSAERLDEWRRIRTGQVDVVLGSRSALFAPIEDLGLIIVDEEHESAYKQDRSPTYHARDVAVRLGALTGATVVLGSATPAVESYWRATTGEYTLIELTERAGPHPYPSPVRGRGALRAPAASAGEGGDGYVAPELPPVTIVDLRAELRAGATSVLSGALQRALHETLERREQAILFLNRRGSASCVMCRECGYVARCEHCDVSLTYHATESALICHYCGNQTAAPQVCPLCWSASIRYFGLGSERVEATVKRMFPAARVLRWDRDTARTRQAHEQLLRAFAERRADILVGTQMIAKGLDLPGVTLVGVVSADTALFLPDFRANERAFQLLTQVAGRAGRGATAGRVLMQTFNPEHFCIQAAAQHDYHTFCAAELSARRQYGYPPFRRFVKLTYEHADRYSAQIEATTLAERLERLIRALGLPETDLVGPAPAFMERLRGRYRWQIILRGADPIPVLRALEADDLPRGWSIDIDPASSL